MPNHDTSAREPVSLPARAAQLERRRETARDEATARRAAEELHALLDDVDNVAELPPR